MTHTQELCGTPDQISKFLRGELNAHEDDEFQLHLENCEWCRMRLESAAAHGDSWQEAKQFLGHEPVPDSLEVSTDGNGESPLLSLQVRQVLDSLAPTDDPEMLGRIGAYEVSGVIGAGGMGVVLKAHERALDRIVAIKVMAPHLASSGSARKRFAREAKATAAVLHSNVIAIHSVSSDGTLPYLVMPYMRGPSLQKRLDADGPLPVNDILRIAAQTAAGLAAAHDQGLVHRDIKPANILLEEGVERVTLTDFGLARAVDDATMTRTGVITGTPQFMSPEQARGESVDQRSDLFSLGSVMYTMCTGRPPFRAETSYGILRRITDTEPRAIREINPEIPEWLCGIIAKLMAKSPDDRFASAGDVAELLEDCLAHVQQPATVPLPELCRSLVDRHMEDQPATRFPRKPPASVVRRIVGAAFAFALIFAGILIVLELNKGTLTIECEADNVPVRIKQGNNVEKRLSVMRGDNSVRIAAGKYLIEIDGAMDGLTVANERVTLRRGGHVVVTIIKDEEQAMLAPRADLVADEPRPKEDQIPVPKTPAADESIPEPPLDPLFENLSPQQQVSLTDPPLWVRNVSGPLGELDWPQRTGPIVLDNERLLIGQSVLDLRTGKEIERLPLATDDFAPTYLRLSGEKTFLMVCGQTVPPDGVLLKPDAVIQVWDISQRKQVGATIGTQLLPITWNGSVAGISADGKVVAAGGRSGKIALWSVVDAQLLKEAPFKSRKLDAIALSPDGQWLVSSDTNDLTFWKWQTNEEPRTVHVGRKIDSLAFSPDSRYLAEGPDTRGDIHLRDMTTLDVIRTVKDKAGSPLIVCAAALKFSADCSKLIAGNEVMVDWRKLKIPYRLLIWDVESGKLLRQIATPNHLVRGVDVSPDGKHIAARLDSSYVAVWSTEKEEVSGAVDEEKVPGVVDRRQAGYPYYTPQGPRNFRAANPPSNEQSKAPRTATHVIAHGDELANGRTPVLVRFRVESSRRKGRTAADGTKTEPWVLSSRPYTGSLDPDALDVYIEPSVEAAFSRIGISDLAQHFQDRQIEVEARVHQSRLGGYRINNDPRHERMLHSMTVSSISQIRIIDETTGETIDDPPSSEAKSSRQSNPATREAATPPDWLVAWDFNYTLLGKRYSVLRIAQSGELEAMFPGHPIVRGQLSRETLNALIRMIAKHPQATTRSQSELSGFSATVSPRPELFDEIRRANVRTEVVAVIQEGVAYELNLDLDDAECLNVTNYLCKQIGLAAIGGRERLVELVVAANGFLAKTNPELPNVIDESNFNFATADESGNLLIWFDPKSDPTLKSARYEMRVPKAGEPTIRAVDVDSNDDRPVGDPPPGAETASDAAEILSVEQLIERGQELSGSTAKVVTVRFPVLSAKRQGVIDPKGKRSELWFLSSGKDSREVDPKDFHVDISASAETALKDLGVSDIPRHFVGKTLSVTGNVSVAALDIWSSPETILTFSITVNSLDQIRVDNGDKEKVPGTGDSSDQKEVSGTDTDVITVDVYGGSEVLPQMNSPALSPAARRHSELLLALNAIKGVTTNFREAGPGDEIRTVIVRDPSRRCQRELQRTGKPSEVRIAIDSAIKAAGIRTVRWEEGLEDEKTSDAVDSADQDEAPGTAEITPRWNRWEIRYPSDPKQFARCLDFFGIELGVPGGGSNDVTYLSKVSEASPAVRHSPGFSEKRLYLNKADGDSILIAKSLMEQAGIETRNQTMLWFYPEATEQILAALESKFANGKSIVLVDKTVFGVRPKADGFEFYVVSQATKPLATPESGPISKPSNPLEHTGAPNEATAPGSDDPFKQSVVPKTSKIYSLDEVYKENPADAVTVEFRVLTEGVHYTDRYAKINNSQLRPVILDTTNPTGGKPGPYFAVAFVNEALDAVKDREAGFFKNKVVRATGFVRRENERREYGRRVRYEIVVHDPKHLEIVSDESEITGAASNSAVDHVPGPDDSLRGAASDAQPTLGKTLNQLQGKWRLTRQIAADGDESITPSNATWEFKGNRVIARDSGGGGAMIVTIDESHSPVHVDVEIETEEETGLGLLSIEGDVLKICLGKSQKVPDPRSRPEKLEAVRGAWYMELRRMKPGESIEPVQPRKRPPGISGQTPNASAEQVK